MRSASPRQAELSPRTCRQKSPPSLPSYFSVKATNVRLGEETEEMEGER